MVDQPSQSDANIMNGTFQKRLTTYCFDNLKHFLKTREILSYPTDFDGVKAPLFVTWLKNDDLRGCIGTFAEDCKLGETLARYSLVSAVQDTRFPPINE